MRTNRGYCEILSEREIYSRVDRSQDFELGQWIFQLIDSERRDA